jgi:uncharacterized membrane protein (DUF485 family)
VIKKKVDRTNNIIGLSIRWIFFIPLAITIYIVSKICLSWTFYYISSQMVEDINSVDDYGGHYFLGPIFIFIREAFAIGFGVYSGVYLVPRHKIKVYMLFILLWVIFLLLISFAIGLTFFRMEWTSEMLLRNLTEIIAQLVGLVVSGIYIWKEQKLIEKDNYTDFERFCRIC